MLRIRVLKLFLCLLVSLLSFNYFSNVSFAIVNQLPEIDLSLPTVCPLVSNPPTTIDPPPLDELSIKGNTSKAASQTKGKGDLTSSCKVVASTSNINYFGFTLKLHLLNSSKSKVPATFTVSGVSPTDVSKQGTDVVIEFNGLTSGKSYTASIQAQSSDLIITQSTITVTLPKDTTPPTTPTNLNASIVNKVSVRLDWNRSQENSSSPVTYEIFQDNILIGTTTENTFLIMNLPENEYTFKIKAKDSSNNYSPPSNAVKVIINIPKDTTPPTTPTNLNASIVNKVSVRLEWNSSQDDSSLPASYEIFQDNTLIGTTTETTFTINNLSENDYTFKVRAKDSSNNYSPLSNVVKVSIILKTNYVYVYDSSSRLVEIKTKTKVITFTYDDNGNILRIVTRKL